jgi:hypothetical protein
VPRALAADPAFQGADLPAEETEPTDHEWFDVFELEQPPQREDALASLSGRASEEEDVRVLQLRAEATGPAAKER